MTKDEQDRIAIQDAIDESGCSIMQVAEDNYMPAFSYTIGLFQQFNHPEIICFGLSFEVMQILLSHVKDRLEDEKVLEVGKCYKGFLGTDVEVSFLTVEPDYYSDYLGYANWFYAGENYPALQLVWPDKKGCLPWEPNFDKELEFYQPLLDRNLDFRFHESRNLGVFTTNNALAGELISYVIHDDEGDWFFLENEEVENDDIQMTNLESLIKKDPSLNDIYYLQYG